ncbi:MAG: RimK family alpha-L-glutamate ligase [Steroidobacteraceae bacterium]
MPALNIALVTARPARGLDEDEPPLHMALQKAGCNVQITEWDDAKVDWASFDVALLRSAWDYAERVSEFLAWVERASKLTHVLNPLQVVRWNTDKHYLAELNKAGVPVVPSTFVEPGEDARRAIQDFLALHAHAEIVVKPAVGAGSRDAVRHRRGELGPAVAHVRRLLDAHRSVLLQPYLERVDRDGETALMFFEGRFSHAIRKGPLLPPGGTATTGLFAAESVTPRVPGTDEMRVAEQAVAAVPFGIPLYARIDLIRDDKGAPCLLELELTEPSLFFVHAAESAEKFTAAVLRCFYRQGK